MHLSISEARRVAIKAQGLHRPPPTSKGSVTTRKIATAVRQLGIVQIDSVNVLARAHLLTLYARLGAYEPEALHRAAYDGSQRQLFEYWGHEASLLPIETYPLWQWRMDDARAGSGIYGGLVRFRKENAKFIDAVLAEIDKRGPLSAGELTDGGSSRGSWWGWSEGKHAIEWLFWAGLVSTDTRRNTFERVYDLTERVLPDEVAQSPTPNREDAQRELLRLALIASGVATEKDLRDYLRLPHADSRARLAELVEAGNALPVSVEGWPATYMAPNTRVPRRVASRALLCPFDPLIWTRDRTERLFGMRFRLEIYVPAAKRIHGYYVLPFLMDEALVARVDLKADRQEGVLRVKAAHLEDDAPSETATELAAALRLLADWLGLSDIAVERRGGLANELRRACRSLR
ncbi:MAG: winged helix DNA-binding domain-containing protein [Phycisphaeraceae bacterium]|nr:winged helix DNA-binding domain-containing protein [Phycisphaeraceae bacterium]